MAGPFGSLGTDYREMQAPEQVSTDLPNNDAALRAEELSGLFKQFENVGAATYNAVQAKRGQLAGAASGATGNPQYRRGGFALTAYGRAFNHAATGAYAVEAQAQADDTAARLRVQANNNPDTFRTTYSAARDAVLKVAPAEAVPMLTELYNKNLADGLAAISGNQALQRQQLQRQTYDMGIQRQTSRVAILQGSTNPDDQLQAITEEDKLKAMIDGGVNAGLYSAAEAQSMHVNTQRTIAEQVFETHIDAALADPNGDVISVLDNFRQMHLDNINNSKEPIAFSEPEFQQLMQNATTKIREYRLTQELARMNGNTAQAARFAAGDAKYTALVLQGQATEKELANAVLSGDLKAETARSLRGLMMQGTHEQPKNPRALLNLEIDPNFLDMKPDQIVNYPGLTSVDALKAYQEQQKRLGSWENTVSVKDAKSAITAALKIPPGTPSYSLTDDERRALTNAQQQFITEMNKIDPAHRDGSAMSVAQGVIQGIHRQDLENQIKKHQQNKQDMLELHGPAPGNVVWSKEKLQKYDEGEDRAIAQLQRQLSGK